MKRRIPCAPAATRSIRKSWFQSSGSSVIGDSPAVAVPPNHPQSLAFAVKFLTEAISNGTLRKAYDNNGLKDRPVRTQTK